MNTVSENACISVVVCTRNRAEQLRRTLQSFCEQRFAGHWEMVVVDNGSTDHTDEVLKRFAVSSPFPLRVVVEPTPGLARARNRGIENATGEIVAFTDDDCYPREDYLEAVWSMFKDLRIDYGGGRLLLYDPTDQRVTIQEKNVPEFVAARAFIPSGLIHGANLVCRKKALMDIHGFDERLGAGTWFKSGEDTDLLRRLALFGRCGFYDPNIVVYHHHGRKTAEAARALENGYRRGFGSCMIKYVLNPASRSTYARMWYWRLRRTSATDLAREVTAALVFLLRYGPSWNQVWRHPHEGLQSRREAP